MSKPAEFREADHIKPALRLQTTIEYICEEPRTDKRFSIPEEDVNMHLDAGYGVFRRFVTAWERI